MSDGSVQTLSTLTAYGVAVGGVDSKVGVSAASSRAIQATGNILVSASSSTLQAIIAAGSANSYMPLGPQLIVATGVGLSGSIDVRSPGIQLPYILAFGAVNPVSVSAQVLQYRIADGTALNGALGRSAASLQPILASSLGSWTVNGTSSVALLPIIARGVAYISTGATFSAVVLQTQLQGLTTYSNFPFNSMARLNGIALAAGDGGLFQLDGASDNGVAIQAAAAGMITDFNSSHRSRVERVYIGYRAVAPLVLRVRTNEVDVRDYNVPANNLNGLHGTHVKIGRGVEARYWQFEIRNQNGADFSLNMIEARPIKLDRRVGGKDA